MNINLNITINLQLHMLLVLTCRLSLRLVTARKKDFSLSMKLNLVLSLQTHNNKPQKQLCFKGERVMWFQPATLKELVALKAQYPTAKLVVGNTEVGKQESSVSV